MCRKLSVNLDALNGSLHMITTSNQMFNDQLYSGRFHNLVWLKGVNKEKNHKQYIFTLI